MLMVIINDSFRMFVLIHATPSMVVTCAAFPLSPSVKLTSSLETVQGQVRSLHSFSDDNPAVVFFVGQGTLLHWCEEV